MCHGLRHLGEAGVKGRMVLTGKRRVHRLWPFLEHRGTCTFPGGPMWKGLNARSVGAPSTC